MDRAAEGLMLAGRALTGIYNAVAQGLPETVGRADRALHLAERAVVALERLAADTNHPCVACGQYRATGPDAYCDACAQDHDGERLG